MIKKLLILIRSMEMEDPMSIASVTDKQATEEELFLEKSVWSPQV